MDILNTKSTKDKKPALILEILLLFFTFFFQSMLVTGESVDFSDGGFPEYMIFYIILSLPQIFLLLYIIQLRGDVPLKNFGITRPTLKDFARGMGYFFVLYIFFIALGWILTLFSPEQQEALTAEVNFNIQGLENVPLVIFFCLVTGYREELFFRSYLLVRLQQLKVSPMAAVMGSSLLFGALHLYEGVMGVLFTTVIGLYFALIFRKTRNLHAIAIAHALYNAFMLVATFYALQKG